MGSILVFSDPHCPFHDKKIIKSVFDVAEEEQPSVIVLTGDTLDFFSFSRFSHNLDLTTPAEELKAGLDARKWIWDSLRKRCPTAKLIELSGNHIARIEKTIINKCPEIASLISIPKLLELPGVEVHSDEKDEITINGILYIHGWLSRPGSHMDFFNHSVIRGHDHQAYLLYRSMNGHTRFEMSVGCTLDMMAVPFKYRATKSVKWTHACGLVDKYGPRIILL